MKSWLHLVIKSHATATDSTSQYSKANNNEKKKK